jgi:hypothetical protein
VITRAVLCERWLCLDMAKNVRKIVNYDLIFRPISDIIRL